jgi:hypothetical protein
VACLAPSSHHRYNFCSDTEVQPNRMTSGAWEIFRDAPRMEGLLPAVAKRLSQLNSVFAWFCCRLEAESSLFIDRRLSGRRK